MTNIRLIKRFFALVAILSLVAACGGGGSSSSGNAPTPFVAVSALAQGASTVDLAWSVNNTTAGSVNIYRTAIPKTMPGVLISTVSGTETSYSDRGLTGSTKYYYTIAAVPASGPTVTSTLVSATTDTAATFPAPVTGFTATRNGSTVTLQWDDYANAATYQIFRTTSAGIPCGLGLTQTNLFGPFVTSVTDTIQGNGHYTYCISVYSAGGTTQSTLASASIDVPAGTLPGVEKPVLDIWTSGKDASVAHIYWWAAPGADAHHVYAAPEVTAGVIPPITPLQGGTSAALDSGKLPIPVYEVSPGYYGMDVPLGRFSPGYVFFAVEAVKGTYAADSTWIGIHVVAPAPVGVTSVRATPMNRTAIDISWNASAGADSYNVYRLGSATDAVSPANKAGTVTGTTFHDTGLSVAATYYYRVTAVASGVESAVSDYAAGTTYNGVIIPNLPFMTPPGTALLSWVSGDQGLTYKIYGGASLLPTSIDPAHVVATVSPDSITGVTLCTQVVHASTTDYAAFILSGGLAMIYGEYSISVVFPDGSETLPVPVIPFVFI